MSLVVPNSLELEVLNDLLNTPLTIRLYGNDVTPASASTVALFTEISGGGYAAKALVFAGWNITAGDPSQAVYNAIQVWTFTSTIDAPGSVYGYYVERDSDNALMWAERFPAANVPFSPENGSLVRVLPKFTAQSLFT